MAVVDRSQAKHVAKVASEVRVIGVAEFGRDLAYRERAILSQSFSGLLQTVSANDRCRRQADVAFGQALNMSRRDVEPLCYLVDSHDPWVCGDQLFNRVREQASFRRRWQSRAGPRDIGGSSVGDGICLITIFDRSDDCAVKVPRFGRPVRWVLRHARTSGASTDRGCLGRALRGASVLQTGRESSRHHSQTVDSLGFMNDDSSTVAGITGDHTSFTRQRRMGRR